MKGPESPPFSSSPGPSYLVGLIGLGDTSGSPDGSAICPRPLSLFQLESRLVASVHFFQAHLPRVNWPGEPEPYSEG